LLAAAGLITGLCLSGTAAGAKEFNASVWFPDAHPITKYGYLDWAKRVKEVSGGELEPIVFTGDVLLPPAGHLSGLRDGIAQVAYHAGTYTATEIPLDNVLAQLMFSYNDYFVSAFAFTDMAMTDPEMLAMWDRNNIVFGGGYSTPPYLLFCREKLESLGDIKGKKLRLAISAAHSSWAEKVGAIPVNVPSNEMYTGLEKGQIDCASNAGNDLKSRSLWDVAKHVTLLELGIYWSGYAYAYNKPFWASLPAQERRILLDTMAEAIVRTGQGYINDAQAALDEAPSHGVAIHQPSAELVRTVHDHAAAARELAIEYGKNRLGIADPEALIKRFETRVAKWNKLLDGVNRNDAAAMTAVLKTNLYDTIDSATYGTN
jgi:TRAP-type C4-dicarboxylate transport system substrate-binding protein